MKNFVEVGYVKRWPDQSGKAAFVIEAPLFHLPPRTKLYVLSDTLDPVPTLVEPTFDRATALALLTEASKTGSKSVMLLAAQLAGVSPCPGCDFIPSACRCVKP